MGAKERREWGEGCRRRGRLVRGGEKGGGGGEGGWSIQQCVAHVLMHGGTKPNLYFPGSLVGGGEGGGGTGFRFLVDRMSGCCSVVSYGLLTAGGEIVGGFVAGTNEG